MKIRNKDQLIASLKKQDVHFSEFSLVHEGEYTIDDADWNYKDVPHLHYIHELVESIFATMHDNLVTTINVQKVFGFTLPLTVVNYESGKNEQTYFTTWLFFILIVRTHYEQIDKNKTRVTTTYHVGSPWLLKWVFPLIRFAIKRNYKNLMSGDIPMRERRGNLRKQGYDFYKETERYSFPKTMEIMETNVLVPNNDEPKVHHINLLKALPEDGEYLHGQDNHLGLRLVRQGKQIHLFARMCLHEGASLDGSTCSPELKLKCPWHGRMHASLLSFNLDDQHVRHSLPLHNLMIHYADNMLTLNEVSTTPQQTACVEEEVY